MGAVARGRTRHSIKPVFARKRDRTFDLAVRPILMPAAVAGLLYFGVLIPAHALVLAPPVSYAMMTIAAASMAYYLTLVVWWQTHPIGEGDEHPWAVAIILPPLANSAVQLILTNNPIESTNLMLVALAIGLVILETRWFIALEVATVIPWALAAFTERSAVWIHWGFALAASVTLACILVIARQHAALQLAAAREHDRLATAELRAAYEDLEAFSYTVSHDLRAPARAVNILIDDVLSEEGLKADLRENLTLARRESERMMALIDDLLALSRTTRADLVRSTVDISHEARAIARDLDERDPTRRVDWQIEPDISVVGDPHLINVVLANLLENAWKYTAASEAPTIRVARDEEVGEDEDGFLVQDNGVGFAAAEAKRIFEPFTRLEPGRFKGTGIGLATVKRIIDRHQGRVTATGDPGKGATFRVALPRR